MKHNRASYIHYGCRCNVCTAANADYIRAWRDSLPAPSVHGVSTYTNHGCRCDVCCAAKAESKRRYLAARQVSP